MESTPASAPAPAPASKQTKADNLIKKVVVKYFEAEPYLGKIASYRKPYYLVKYDDGDREEYTKAEVQKLLLIGKKVVNYFDNQPYTGIIESYKHPYYKVKYDDGDEEEYTKAEVKELLIPF